MKSLFVIIAIAIIAMALLIPRLFTKKTGSRQLKQVRPSTGGDERSSTQWRAVRIAPGLICCDAVGKLADQVFLASESPTLPLGNCSQKDCRCKYIHLEDRRSGGDRRVELGDLGAFLPISQTERRQVMGRRAADQGA